MTFYNCDIFQALVRPWARENGSSKTFHWIGIASSFYLLASFVHSIHSGHFEKFQNDSNVDQRSSSTTLCDVSKRCSLCLEEMKNTSCTPCGHLFCWSCILEWLSSKSECPLCREPTQQSRVVQLQNFEQSVF
jgi:peroxin-10